MAHTNGVELWPCIVTSPENHMISPTKMCGVCRGSTPPIPCLCAHNEHFDLALYPDCYGHFWRKGSWSATDQIATMVDWDLSIPLYPQILLLQVDECSLFAHSDSHDGVSLHRSKWGITNWYKLTLRIWSSADIFGMFVGKSDFGFLNCRMLCWPKPACKRNIYLVGSAQMCRQWLYSFLNIWQRNQLFNHVLTLCLGCGEKVVVNLTPKC